MLKNLRCEISAFSWLWSLWREAMFLLLWLMMLDVQNLFDFSRVTSISATTPVARTFSSERHTCRQKSVTSQAPIHTTCEGILGVLSMISQGSGAFKTLGCLIQLLKSSMRDKNCSCWPATSCPREPVPSDLFIAFCETFLFWIIKPPHAYAKIFGIRGRFCKCFY